MDPVLSLETAAQIHNKTPLSYPTEIAIAPLFKIQITHSEYAEGWGPGGTQKMALTLINEVQCALLCGH